MVCFAGRNHGRSGIAMPAAFSLFVFSFLWIEMSLLPRVIEKQSLCPLQRRRGPSVRRADKGRSRLTGVGPAIFGQSLRNQFSR